MISKRYTAWIAALLVALLAPLAVSAKNIELRPPEVSGKAWLLIDYHSGQVLAAHNSEIALPPASLTKLAVAYVLFQRLRDGKVHLADTVTVSAHAAQAQGTSMFLRTGEKISVEELLRGLLAVSANDAAIALAEHVADTETAFVAQMNAVAQNLGMTRTHFVTANGLPAPGHTTTARDLARLSTALLRDFPENYTWFSIKEFAHNGIRQYNRNALLWRDPTVDGFKTGQTREAGYCIIASAKRDAMRLIVVVLGEANENARVVSAQQLLNYGFHHYETRLLYNAHTPLTKIRIWMGNSAELSLGPTHDLYLTLPRGWYDRIQAHVTVARNQVAPVRIGQPIGSISIDLDQTRIAEYPLVALQDVAEGNVFQRALDFVRLRLQ